MDETYNPNAKTFTFVLLNKSDQNYKNMVQGQTKSFSHCKVEDYLYIPYFSAVCFSSS